jgi:uncharacterized paraquat-inducible protein A
MNNREEIKISQISILHILVGVRRTSVKMNLISKIFCLIFVVFAIFSLTTSMPSDTENLEVNVQEEQGVNNTQDGLSLCIFCATARRASNDNECSEGERVVKGRCRKVRNRIKESR